MSAQTIGKWRRVLVGIAALLSLPPSPRDCLDICSISVRLGVDVARHASPIFLHPSLDHVAPVFDISRTADGPLGWEEWGAAERPPHEQAWHIPFGVSELGGHVVGCALMLTRTSQIRIDRIGGKTPAKSEIDHSTISKEI